ncbi:MAG: patatin-like phospholipase family protein [Dehalococcoidia bacterium]
MSDTPTFFAGLSDEDLQRVLAPLERRQFPVNATVLVEGDCPREMYVVAAGAADVLIADRHGGEHRVGSISAGATIGEMSLFTGQAASATVRAVTALDVIVIGEIAFRRIAESFPRIYHNLGALLSQRLALTNRQTIASKRGRVTVLEDQGAPPILGYALASSIAWHTRKPTAYVLISNDPPSTLLTLAARDEAETASRPMGAQLRIVSSGDGGAPETLPAMVDDLALRYEHVLIQVRQRVGLVADRTVRLLDTNAPSSAELGDRPGHTIRAWAAPSDQRGPDAHGVLHVPSLEPADDLALATGLLPNTTPAGRLLGWSARDLAGLKVGLVFGAGSVKGYAHYGVWRVLERIGLTADFVTGTSIGAIVGSTYALGLTAEEAARNMEQTSARAFRLNFPTKALLSNAGVRMNFQQVAGDTRFEDLATPLAIVTADIVTGQEVVLRRGLLRTAALASMAIPGIYPPLQIGPYTLVDGGIVNPVPIDVAAEMGADVVIAVPLRNPAPQPPEDIEAIEANGKLPSIVQTVSRAIDVMQSAIATRATTTPSSRAAATILIEPDLSVVPNLGLRSFSQGRPYIAPGEAAAESALPRMRAALPWLRA